MPVLFSQGHETDPRDHGRPVALIAGALGIAPEVFRDAFSRVRPAPAGTEPDRQQVRRNKTVLLDALGRYGISNDELDRVSNYYRYNRGRGESWPTKPATAYAIVEQGKIKRFVITNGGSGYSSAPVVTIPGLSGIRLEACLSFSKELAKNGTIRSIVLIDSKARFSSP